MSTTGKDNISFVLRGIEETAYENRPVPGVSGGDVLVEVKKTGICGTDVHYFVDGRIGKFVLKNPVVLGHESSGVIAKVGPDVKHLKVGQRVALEPGQTCGTCDACKAGSYELCPHIIFAATPPYDGTLARYYCLPADLAYPLPDNLSLEDGALIEPLAVAVHTLVPIGKARANHIVAVFGAGPVGLLLLAVAKALGAKRVICIDINKSRLEFARSYAATDVYVPLEKEKTETSTAYSTRDTANMKKQLDIDDRGTKGVDIVVDATGAEVCIQSGILLAKEGGTFIQVGMGHADVIVPITHLLTKELTVKGSLRFGPGDYQLAIDLAAQGKVNLKSLVTHRFAFDDAAAAFEITRKGRCSKGIDVIKAMISGPDVSVESH